MIPLNRDHGKASIPARFKDTGARENARWLVEAYYSGGTTHRIEFDPLWTVAKGALKQESSGKCAYCEASTETVAYGDVEHFRPKSIYWWLALCYHNYLYSCQLCNQAHKRDRFPVRAARLTAPVMPDGRPAGEALEALIDRLTFDGSKPLGAEIADAWRQEQSELIDPYLEDPERFFSYRVDEPNSEVWIEAVGHDERCSSVAEVLGLNREELLRARYGDYRIFASLKVILLAAVPEDVRALALTEFVRLQGRSQPFSGMHRYFAREWNLPGPDASAR